MRLWLNQKRKDRKAALDKGKQGFIVFIAEMGDKAQLVSLILATRYNARLVLAGIFIATLIVRVFSAALCNLAGELLPADWIRYLAGPAFIGFGLWTLRGDSLDTSVVASNHERLADFMLHFRTKLINNTDLVIF